MPPKTVTVSTSGHDLDKDLVRSDHTQFASGLFLNHFKTLFQISNLRRELFVRGLGVGVFEDLFIEAPLHVADAWNTAPTIPELGLK